MQRKLRTVPLSQLLPPASEVPRSVRLSVIAFAVIEVGIVSWLILRTLWHGDS